MNLVLSAYCHSAQSCSLDILFGHGPWCSCCLQQTAHCFLVGRSSCCSCCHRALGCWSLWSAVHIGTSISWGLTQNDPPVNLSFRYGHLVPTAQSALGLPVATHCFTMMAHISFFKFENRFPSSELRLPKGTLVGSLGPWNVHFSHTQRFIP